MSRMFGQAFVEALSKGVDRAMAEVIKDAGIETAAFGNAAQGIASNAAASSTPISSAISDTVEQMKDKKFQASKLGFTVDAFVTEKKAEELRIYKITSVIHEHVKLVEQVDGNDGSLREVHMDEFLAGWRLHKAKVTARLPNWDFDTNRCSPLSSQSWRFEVTKGAITIALHEMCQKYEDMLQHVHVMTNPAGVKVTKGFKPGGLKLVPASQRLDKKSAKDTLYAGSFEVTDGTLAEVHIYPQFVAPLNVKGEANKYPWVAPFWSVQAVKDETCANMKLQVEIVEVRGQVVEVPMLVLSKEVKSGDELTWVKISRVANAGRKRSGGAGKNAPKKPRPE